MVLSVAQPSAQDSQMRLLQYQMQQFLDQLNPKHFEVRIDWEPLVRFSEKASPSQLNETREINAKRATLLVLEQRESGMEPTICWVIDVDSDASMPPAESLASLRANRAQSYARLAIADYWQLTPAQSALKTYDSPSSSGYRQQHLWHVGDRVSPTAIPEITLRLQEPLPLHFLTRTLKGTRTYPSQMLPLQVCSQ